MTSPIDRSVVEALLFATDEPLSVAQLKKVLGDVEVSAVREALDAIRSELDERHAGFALAEVAGGFQLRTRPEHATWIRQLRSERPPRLSKPALETLAVVSYKQPVTRAEIETIRRVDTGAVLKTLLERRLLKIVGHKDVPGRPALYGTSREFLEVFGLKSLKELPTLKEIREVAAQMGDALDVPRELLPPEVADALPESAHEPGEVAGIGEPAQVSDDSASSSPVQSEAEEDADMTTDTTPDSEEPAPEVDDQSREAPEPVDLRAGPEEEEEEEEDFDDDEDLDDEDDDDLDDDEDFDEDDEDFDDEDVGDEED